MKTVSTSIDGLIFDLDGTLADSLGDIGDATNEVLAAYGLPALPIELFKHLVGEGAEILLRRAVRAAQGRDWRVGSDALPAELKVLLDGYRQAYDRMAHRKSSPYPGIEAMLDGVVRAGRPMAVLSNKRDEFTKHLVHLHFGRWPFVDVRGEREGVPRKPDPTAALELGRSLGVSPERIGFVGDTPIDMRTANAAGMVSIGALWGFRSREELVEAKARYLLERPEDLLRLLPTPEMARGAPRASS